jgi:hypothetical protein
VSVTGLATDAAENGTRATLGEAQTVEQDSSTESAFATALDADISRPMAAVKHAKRPSGGPKTVQASEILVGPTTGNLKSAADPPSDAFPWSATKEGRSGSERADGDSDSRDVAPSGVMAEGAQARRSSDADGAPSGVEFAGSLGAPPASARSDGFALPLSPAALSDLVSGNAPVDGSRTSPVHAVASRAQNAYGAASQARSLGSTGRAASDNAGARSAQNSVTASSGYEGALLPSAKGVTGVNVPSQMSAPGPGRLQQAALSAANQAVLRREASGEIDHPDLGRVVVRAQSHGGSIDVELQSDREETHGILHASAGALAADLREADVALGALSFVSADGAGVGLGSSQRQGGPASDTSRERPDSERSNDENERPAARLRRRVRIVL